eukprot:m51a1_g284 putative inositol 5-phosphatase (611) ;mRNA; r:325028-327330
MASPSGPCALLAAPSPAPGPRQDRSGSACSAGQAETAAVVRPRVEMPRGVSLQSLAGLSAEQRAEAARGALGQYYAALREQVLAHVFRFAVRVGVLGGRRRLLEADLAAGLVTRYRRWRKTVPKERWRFSDIAQVVRVREDARVLELRGAGGKVASFVFETSAERERFYGACSLGLRGLRATEQAPRTEPLRVLVATWNVGGECPREPPVAWLQPGRGDVVAVCTQECTHEAEYNRIVECLAADYVRLDYASILYVKLAVFVKREHAAKVRFVEKTTEATGIAGIVGNKGAVAISFTLNETSLCFVGCHLAAHQNNAEERNRQWHAIVKNLRMGESRRVGLENQFDHIVWCGDFNYRIDLQPDEVVACVRYGNLAKLRAHDQLTRLRQRADVFLDHAEGELTFAPTYKMNKGAPGYLLAKRNARVPSWCDRVLWASLPGCSPLRQLQYASVESVDASDHRPVYAAFELDTLLPCCPAFAAPLRVSFSALTARLRGRARDAQGPFALYIVAPFAPRGPVETTQRPRSAEGVVAWEDEVRAMDTWICDPAYAAAKHVYASVWDRASGEHVAECAVPLTHACSAMGQQFEVRLVRHGDYAGRLFGSARVFPAQ